MLNLQRITTEYVEAEDRIRLSGENEQGETLVLWLTQRLLSQVIPHLIGLVEKQSPSTGADQESEATSSSLMHGFAQQAAEAELGPEQPVETAASAQSWLIQEVDIAVSPESTVILVFKREIGTTIEQDAEDLSALTLEPKQLRQWLSIMHSQWQRAAWPVGLWPDWMHENQEPANSGPMH